MSAYDTMYKKLFNAITNAISILQVAQIETEAMYINHKPGIKMLKPDDPDGESEE